MPLPPPLCDGPIPPQNLRAPARSSPVFRHSCRGAAPIDPRCGPSTPASDPPAATAARASSPPWRPAFSPARPGNAPGSGSRGLVHNTADVEPQLGCHAGSRSPTAPPPLSPAARSEEHTSELQSLRHLVCRLLLEKKKKSTQMFNRRLRVATHKKVRGLTQANAGISPRFGHAPQVRRHILPSPFVFFFLMIGRPPRPTLFPYPALFR